MMHPLYLPFTEKEVSSHFSDVKQAGECVKSDHLRYYKESIGRYEKYLAETTVRTGRPLKDARLPCQIEKDERFWTVACLMTLFHGRNRTRELIELCRKAFGEIPDLSGLISWEECLQGDLHLFFEPNLPSPASYRQWLRENIGQRHFVPYVLHSAANKANLEGATNVDAMVLNSTNGFAIVIEAKVLSDISCEITYDVMRNQIARNVDVMLEKSTALCPPLRDRDPDRSLFALITPKLFRDEPSSRLYGYKLREYRRNPKSLAEDLPHRAGYDWERLSRRLGWLTWEDFRHVNRDCCRWLED